MNSSTTFNLSLSESNQLKGIALMLLLTHHLFYVQNGLYDDIVVHGHGFVQEMGMVCKVCVALFIFLSGYGLTKKYANSKINIRRFYVERFAKLMPSYWLIWLLFVPIGVLFFDRTFESVYGDNYILKGVIEFLGLQCFTGISGINPTWWFMTCIITLYLLYPLLLLIMQRGYERWVLGGSFLLLFTSVTDYSFIAFYLFPFVLGIHCGRGAVLPPPIQNIPILVGITILTTIWRQFGIGIHWWTIDPILAFEIILLFKAINIKRPLIVTILSFIGRHSMNIFLFHTFIFYYYFEKYIYITRNPLLIFLSLLFVCLVISVGIEYLKKILHFEQCRQMIINKLK